MKFKKILALGVSAAMAAAMLAGCGKNNDDANKNGGSDKAAEKANKAVAAKNEGKTLTLQEALEEIQLSDAYSIVMDLNANSDDEDVKMNMTMKADGVNFEIPKVALKGDGVDLTISNVLVIADNYMYINLTAALVDIAKLGAEANGTDFAEIVSQAKEIGLDLENLGWFKFPIPQQSEPSQAMQDLSTKFASDMLKESGISIPSATVKNGSARYEISFEGTDDFVKIVSGFKTALQNNKDALVKELNDTSSTDDYMELVKGEVVKALKAICDSLEITYKSGEVEGLYDSLMSQVDMSEVSTTDWSSMFDDLYVQLDDAIAGLEGTDIDMAVSVVYDISLDKGTIDMSVTAEGSADGSKATAVCSVSVKPEKSGSVKAPSGAKDLAAYCVMMVEGMKSNPDVGPMLELVKGYSLSDITGMLGM